MNIQRTKALVWLGALACGGGLAWEVSDFLKNKEVLQRYVGDDVKRAALEDVPTPEAKKDELVGYTSVKSAFLDMNWTGEDRTPPPPPPEDNTPEEKPKTPVSDILRVLVLQVDTLTPEGSRAMIHYTDSQVQNDKLEPRDRTLRVEDRLQPPFDNIRVEEITPEGVLFAFDEEGREPERLAPAVYEGDTYESIVVLGVGESAQIPEAVGFGSVKDPQPFNPRETQLVGKDIYRIGTETAKQVNQDYSRILSQDVKYRTVRNPSDGSIKGIQITDVREGSLPAQHGLKKGETLISINGHKVTSVNDAVAYVKKESDTTTRWVAVFENQGRQYSRTYDSPSE